jgi:hypothetical protein
MSRILSRCLLLLLAVVAPLAVGDRVYIANQDGRITAFTMGEQWTQAGELLVAGPKEKFLLSAEPLFTAGRMIVQTRDALICYGP